MQTSGTSAAQLAKQYPEGHRKRAFFEAVEEFEGSRETRPHLVKRGFAARVVRRGDPTTLARRVESVRKGDVVRFPVEEKDTEQSARAIALWRMLVWI